MEYIDVGGARLAVQMAGPENGPLLVLLHGFPEFSYGWHRVMEPLARAGYRVVAPDQRGYGWSDKPPRISDYRIEALVGDIKELIAALGYKRAFVAGHDWGGIVAWSLALACPQMVERAVILNVPHPKVMKENIRSNPTQRKKSWYIAFFQVPKLPEWWLSRRNFRQAKKTLKNTSRPGTFSEADLRRYHEAWSQPGAFRAMINWYRAAIRGSNSRAQWLSSKVQVPVLLIWGKKDKFLGSEMAEPSIELCVQGQLEFLENATHWVVHEEPEQVVKLMTRFLT